MRRFPILFLFLTVQVLFGDESDPLDQLFQNPAGDVVAVEGPKVDLTPLFVTPRPVFTGSTSMTGGLWAAWNEGLDGGGGYTMTTSFNVDYRPDPTLHLAGTVSSSVPVGSFDWTPPAVSAMYLDYTLMDTLFLTMGKFSMSWGVGRLFNVNTLVDQVENGLAAKGFLPVGPFNLTGVVLARREYFRVPASPRYDEYGLAGLMETSFGPLNLGVSAFRQKDQPQAIDAYLKTAFVGFDLFAEARITRLAQGGWEAPVAMAGFFWEGLSPKLSIQGEWTGTDRDHSFALASSWAIIPGTALKPSAKWTHAFIDGSGQIVVGLEGDPWAHIHVSAGVPVSYGKTTSRWVVNTIETYHRSLSLGLKLDLSTSY